MRDMTVEANVPHSELVFEQSIQHSIWSMFHGYFASVKNIFARLQIIG